MHNIHINISIWQDWCIYAKNMISIYFDWNLLGFWSILYRWIFPANQSQNIHNHFGFIARKKGRRNENRSKQFHFSIFYYYFLLYRRQNVLFGSREKKNIIWVYEYLHYLQYLTIFVNNVYLNIPLKNVIGNRFMLLTRSLVSLILVKS